MPPRASKRVASAKKPSPKSKNATPPPKSEAVPLAIIEDDEGPASAENNTEEVKEIKQEEEVFKTKVQDVEGLSPSGDVVKVVIKEEVSVSKMDFIETKISEEGVGEKNLVTGDAMDEEEPEEEDPEEEDPEEANSGEDVDNGTQMNLDQGAKQNVEGFANGDGTAVANENVKEEEGDNSERDDADNEEDEDPSVYLQAPLTERKKQKECEIFVGGLDREAVEEDLLEIFGKFGEIQSARIIKHPKTQRSKGFAFIQYATVEQAKRVLADLKDGTEVKGKRVGIAQSQDNDTLYMGNICKTWTKEHVLETLKSFGIEGIEEVHLIEDPKTEGKSKGFAFLEFSTQSDATTAYKRLRDPNAVFGCDRSAKVAFALSSMRPNEEALSQGNTVFIEGLADSRNEEKVKELCKQYGVIEKVLLPRNRRKKQKDTGFVTFTSRESAMACVEGINNSQIGEGDVKVKANLAMPRVNRRAVRGGHKVQKEVEKTREVPGEAGPPILKEDAKSERPGKKRKARPKLRSAEGGKPFKSQTSVAGNQVSKVPSGSGKTNRQRKEQPVKGRKHGNMRDRPTSGFKNRKNRSRFEKPRKNYEPVFATHGNPYSQSYAERASGYQGHAYGGAVSGSKRHHSDMEPHAGYLQPAHTKEKRVSYGYGPRSAGRYGGQGSGDAVYGGPIPYPPPPPSYASYEAGSSGSGYGYPSGGTYLPPRRAYY